MGGQHKGVEAQVKRRRFSLIELLVVVSILAILLTILLPALSRAKDSAKQISCATRQKQVLASFAMYADDYDGFYPAIIGDASSGGPLSWPGGFFMQLGRYMGYPCYPGHTGRDGKGLRMDSAFVCPAAIDGENADDMGNKWQMGIGMSAYLPTDPGWPARYNKYPNSREINNPSTRILTADSFRTSLEGHWDFTSTNHWLALYWKRHNKGANLGFCDGHVEWAAGKEILAKGLAKTLYIDFSK